MLIVRSNIESSEELTIKIQNQIRAEILNAYSAHRVELVSNEIIHLSLHLKIETKAHISLCVINK